MTVRLLYSSHRHTENNTGTLSVAFINHQVSTQPFGNNTTNGQTEPCSLTKVIQLHKALKNTFLFLNGNTDSGICNRENQLILFFLNLIG